MRPVAFDARGPLSLEAFEAAVRGVAALLPATRHAINLCEDRHLFLVAFCAAAIRDQTTLLPPSRAPVRRRSSTSWRDGRSPPSRCWRR